MVRPEEVERGADEEIAAGVEAALGFRKSAWGVTSTGGPGQGSKGEEGGLQGWSGGREKGAMLTIRPTKMLAKRLKLTVPATPPPVANRVADWCVHEFTGPRYHCLIFCNTASLYPVVVPGRGVRDDHDLIMCLINGLKMVMLGTELEFQFQRWIVPELAEVQWAPIPDKTVLSSVNELILQARYAMDKSPVELSRWLAETPMKAIGYNFPDRVFRAMQGK